MMLSGQGEPEMPLGGSVERRLKSRMRRLRQFVDCQELELDVRTQGIEGLTMIYNDDDVRGQGGW